MRNAEVKKKVLYIDGDSSERINGYAQWKIIDEDGNVLCTCFGPMSALIAATAVREYNNGNASAVVDVLQYDVNKAKDERLRLARAT